MKRRTDYSPALRRQAINYWKENQREVVTKSSTARKFGIPTSTFGQWLAEEAEHKESSAELGGDATLHLLLKQLERTTTLLEQITREK